VPPVNHPEEEKAMHGSNEFDLKTICREILSAFKGLVTWKWDDRFGTLQAEFDVDTQDAVRAILDRFFGITWDSANIEQAPEIVRLIDRHLGGLRPGQFFFNTDPNQDAFVFCAWWPWGNGRTISIRMAPFDKNLTGAEETALIETIKGWAGV
jgi:hypothetical protein